MLNGPESLSTQPPARRGWTPVLASVAQPGPSQPLRSPPSDGADRHDAVIRRIVDTTRQSWREGLPDGRQPNRGAGDACLDTSRSRGYRAGSLGRVPALPTPDRERPGPNGTATAAPDRRPGAEGAR